MKGLFRNVMQLVGLLSGLYGGSAYAVDVQVTGGLVTFGSAEISSDSTGSTFGYKVDSYSGNQLGLTLIWDDKSSLMLNTRQLSGTANTNSGSAFGEMKRQDTTIAYSRAFLEPFFGVDGGLLIGWKTGSSHVTAGGTDYFNFSSSGPLVGANLSHKFSSSLVGKGDVSYQYISDGTYRPSFQPSADKATSAYSFGLGLGLAYLVNEHFSAEADYKYSFSSYSFDTATTVSDVNEKISHIELTAKYKF